MMSLSSLLALLALATPPQTPAPEPVPVAEAPLLEFLPVGSSRTEVDLDGTKLEVFTHKPKGWRGERMLLVFHGVLRNADEYRDHAVVLAERFSMLVIAPRFDEERFPSIKYQRGGILRENGTAAKPEEWTYSLVPKLARAIREREAKPALKHWLIGHSAGGQFCMRMAAFQDTGAERIIASNPGTALFPTRTQDFGYGFGKLPAELASDEILKRYLAAPLTLYLAQEDNKEDEYLDTSEAGMHQGPGRLQRNRAAFAAAESLAREKSWPCSWRIVEVPEVGHDHELMFQHPLAEQALFGPPAAPPQPKK